jgi:hypothetical protein
MLMKPHRVFTHSLGREVSGASLDRLDDLHMVDDRARHTIGFVHRPAAHSTDMDESPSAMSFNIGHLPSSRIR